MPSMFQNMVLRVDLEEALEEALEVVLVASEATVQAAFSEVWEAAVE